MFYNVHPFVRDESSESFLFALCTMSVTMHVQNYALATTVSDRRAAIRNLCMHFIQCHKNVVVNNKLEGVDLRALMREHKCPSLMVDWGTAMTSAGNDAALNAFLNMEL